MSVDICVLGSGSSGNATYISAGGTRILVDCGLPAREIVSRLATLNVQPHQLSAILISHAHTDHFTSAGTIHAKFGVPVCTDRHTDAAIRRKNYCGSFRRIPRTLEFPERLGNIRIEVFDVPHGDHRGGVGRPVGFIVEHAGIRVVHVTDIGEFSPALCRKCAGAQCYVIEANYHEPVVKSKLEDESFADDWERLEWVLGPRGHLSNQQCAEALSSLVDGRTTDVFLAHLSENHHDSREDNNDFHHAMSLVSQRLTADGQSHARIHRTYRRGRTEGVPSVVVTIR
jgi:phosphoribosyl 1,2-cyclic phosphodiesterase